MIWLMTGSGGLFPLDSEPGCSLFRVGPENLQREEKKKKDFLNDSHSELYCEFQNRLSPSSVDWVNDSPVPGPAAKPAVKSCEAHL